MTKATREDNGKVFRCADVDKVCCQLPQHTIFFPPARASIMITTADQPSICTCPSLS